MKQWKLLHRRLRALFILNIIRCSHHCFVIYYYHEFTAIFGFFTTHSFKSYIYGTVQLYFRKLKHLKFTRKKIHEHFQTSANGLLFQISKMSGIYKNLYKVLQAHTPCITDLNHLFWWIPF